MQQTQIYSAMPLYITRFINICETLKTKSKVYKSKVYKFSLVELLVFIVNAQLNKSFELRSS